MKETRYQFRIKSETMRTFFFLMLLNANAQDIGDRCLLRDGSSGNCDLITSCILARAELQQRIRPNICGFEGMLPIVCCGGKKALNPEERTLTRISEEKCQEYLKLDIKTTITTTTTTTTTTSERSFVPFVVGGVNAYFEEFPHMAILGYGTNSNIEFRCGGSLISDQFVLTAAHCLDSRENGPVSLIRLGDLDIASNTEFAEPQEFGISEIHPHPDYDFESFYNDIALIKLNRTVIYTRYVKPACIQTEFDLENNNLTVTGWGATDYGGDLHSYLQKVDLYNLPLQSCLPTYRPQQRLTRGIDEELQICGGDPARTVDACQGDSGGPLQLKIQYFPQVYRIVGVTSFGTNCGLVPGIYTRVSKYVSWIESIVWPN